MDFKSKPAVLKLFARVDKAAKTFSTNVNFTYVFPKIARDKIFFKTKFLDHSSKSRTKLKTSM